MVLAAIKDWLVPFSTVLAAIKDWLVPFSTSVGIVAVVVGLLLSLREYNLKLRAEARLAESAQVESDIKLLKLFVEIMDIAHARGPSMVVSDKLFEAMLPKLQEAGVSDIKAAAVITLPIGSAAQDAAISAICELGKKHPILRPVAIRALESLSTFKAEIAAPLLEELHNHRGG
jgi:hypothetical protein